MLSPIVLCSGAVFATEGSEAAPEDDEYTWEEAAEKMRPCEPVNLNKIGWFDRAHLLLSEGVCEQALWFDSFFGDIEENEPASSLVRLFQEVRWHKEDGWDFRPRISASFFLPRASRRLQLIIEGDGGNTNTAQRENDNLDPRSDSSFAAALRYTLKELERADLKVDGGVRIRGGTLDPFARLRLRYNIPLADNIVAKASQQLLVRDSDGWSETTKLDFDLLQRNVGYRWGNRATYGEETEGFEWEIFLARAEQLSYKAAYTVFLSFSGSTDDDPDEDRLVRHSERTRIGMNYRRSFYRPWMFYEIEPQLNWEREYDWDLNPAIVFKLEFQLGKSRRKSNYVAPSKAEGDPQQAGTE